MLAIASAAARLQRCVLPIGLGGCYGWRGRIGKTETPSGGRTDEYGVLPDIERIEWRPILGVTIVEISPQDRPHVRRNSWR